MFRVLCAQGRLGSFSVILFSKLPVFMFPVRIWMWNWDTLYYYLVFSLNCSNCNKTILMMYVAESSAILVTNVFCCSPYLLFLFSNTINVSPLDALSFSLSQSLVAVILLWCFGSNFNRDICTLDLSGWQIYFRERYRDLLQMKEEQKEETGWWGLFSSVANGRL